MDRLGALVEARKPPWSSVCVWHLWGQPIYSLGAILIWTPVSLTPEFFTMYHSPQAVDP